MNTTFRVKEFADLAGVTVRTLQYYDRVGLLKPSGYTKDRHRLYKVEDLLRLQQILTFKHVGYGLEEIRQLLDSPTFNIREALEAQRRAISERVVQMQKVLKAIDRTLGSLDEMDSTKLDWKLVRDVITGVIASDRWDWIREYYTQEQRKVLADRSKGISPSQMVEWQRTWAEVMAGFQQLMTKQRSPADAEAQKLAAQAQGMLQTFTQGDKGIERSLGRAYANLDKVSKEQRPVSVELQKYMSEAVAIYKRNHPA